MATIVADLAAYVSVQGVAAATAELSVFNSEINQTTTASRGASAGAAALGLAAALGFKHAISDAADFQFVMQSIRAKIDNIGDGVKLTNAQYDAMSAKALQLGRDTIFGATDAANAMYALVRAGVPVKTIIDDATQAALDLAGAVDASVPDAARVLGVTINQFADQGIKAGHIADILSVAGLKSGASFTEFGTGLNYAGKQLDLLGDPLAEVAATVSYLTQRLGNASIAGTGLRTSIAHIVNPSKEAAAWLEANNIQLKDAQGNFIGTAALADELKAATQGLSSTEKARIANMLAGQRGQQVVMQMMQDGGDVIRKYTAEVDKNGTALSIMQEKMDSLRGALHQLSGSINSMFVIMGSALLPVVQLLAKALTALVNVFVSLDPALQRIVSIGLAIGGLLAIIQGFDAAAMILFGAHGSAILGGFASALEGLLGPLTLVIGAASLFYAAWSLNVMGLRDDLTSFFQDLAHYAELLVSSFTYLVTHGVNPVSAALDALLIVLSDLGFDGLASALARASIWFAGVYDIATRTANAFTFLLAHGVNPLNAALDALAIGMGDAGFAHFSDWLATASVWLDKVWAGLHRLADGFGKVFDGGYKFSHIIIGLPAWMKPVGVGLVDLVSGLGKLYHGFTDGGLDGIVKSWPDAWRQISNGIRLSADAIGGWLQGALDAAVGVAARLADWTLDVGVPAITGWLSIFGHDAWIALKAAAGFFGRLTAELGDWELHTAIPAVAGWLADLARDAWPALIAAAHIAGNLIANLHAWTLNVGLPTLGGDIKSIAGHFGPWLLTQLERGYTGTVKVGTLTLAFSKTEVDAASKSNAATAIKDDLVSAVRALNTFGHDVAKAAWDAIGGFSGWATLVTDDPYSIGAKIGSALHDVIIKGIQKLGQQSWGGVLKAVAEAMATAATAAPALMLSVATAIVSGFTGFVVSLVGGPKAAADFKQFADKVRDGLARLFRTGWDVVGRAVVDGFKNGIDDEWTSINDWVAGIVDKFIGWFKHPLGIMSPSTVFHQIGVDIIDGLKNGLVAEWETIKGWVEGAVNWLKGKFNDILGFFGAGGGGQGNVPVTGPGSITDPNAGGKEHPGAVGGGGGAATSGGGAGGIVGMIQNALGGAGAGSGTLTGQLGQMGTDAGNAFNQNLYAGLRKAQDSAAAVWSHMKADAQSLLSAFQAFATTTGATFNTLLYPGLLAAQNTAQAVWTAILASTQTFLAGMQAFATTTGNSFNTLLYPGLLAAQNTALAVFNQIQVYAGNFVQQLGAFATAAGNLFNQNLYYPGLLAAQTTVANTMAAIQNIIGGATGNMEALGANLGNALADGLYAALPAVILAATVLSQAAQAATTATNAIHSPSRVYRWFGQMIGQGLALGMADMRPQVANAAAGLLGAPSLSPSGAFGAHGPVHNGNIVINVYETKDAKSTGQEVLRQLAAARATAKGGY